MRAVDDFVGSEKGKFGILQLDAHMDLRTAFEGFEQSHASILHNALDRCSNLKRVVMIGIRDYCEAELDHPARKDGRVVAHFDQDWARRRAAGETVMALIDEAIQQLPDAVYITVDIDGLSPELCPGTGTPVPGGLNFRRVRADPRASGPRGQAHHRLRPRRSLPDRGRPRMERLGRRPCPLQTLRLRDGEPGGGGASMIQEEPNTARTCHAGRRVQGHHRRACHGDAPWRQRLAPFGRGAAPRWRAQI